MLGEYNNLSKLLCLPDFLQPAVEISSKKLSKLNNSSQSIFFPPSYLVKTLEQATGEHSDPGSHFSQLIPSCIHRAEIVRIS